MKLSDWQNGVPPCDGIWQYEAPDVGCNFFARNINGVWYGGYTKLECAKEFSTIERKPNTLTTQFTRWRGLIDE